MSTLLQWAKNVQGTALDLDGSYGPQCMDLARSYLRTCHVGVDITGNAVDVGNQRLPGWRWVENGPVNFPPPGALVVWHANAPRAGTGAFGHIAVVLTADPRVLLTLDQNWGGANFCRTVLHTYDGVWGWHVPPALVGA